MGMGPNFDMTRNSAKIKYTGPVCLDQECVHGIIPFLLRICLSLITIKGHVHLAGKQGPELQVLSMLLFLRPELRHGLLLRLCSGVTAHGLLADWRSGTMSV